MIRAPAAAGLFTLLALITSASFGVRASVKEAGRRLEEPDAAKPKVAVADHAEAAYCTPKFKEVLERVLHSCGLLGEGNARRGCKPSDVKNFASIDDEDFNALFSPLRSRGAILKFDTGRDEIDTAARKLLDETWLARKGARYFFVVGRASQSGDSSKNRALSHRRANSVMFHLKESTGEQDLERRVGLLWLGEEFAQLPKEFCEWPNSKPTAKCTDASINQTAFVSWVDCRL